MFVNDSRLNSKFILLLINTFIMYYNITCKLKKIFVCTFYSFSAKQLNTIIISFCKHQFYPEILFYDKGQNKLDPRLITIFLVDKTVIL